MNEMTSRERKIFNIYIIKMIPRLRLDYVNGNEFLSFPL